MSEVRRWSWSGLETPGDRLSGTVPGVISKDKENFILKLHILYKVHPSTWKAGLLEESACESLPRSLSLVYSQTICLLLWIRFTAYYWTVKKVVSICRCFTCLVSVFISIQSFCVPSYAIIIDLATKNGNYTPGTPETLRCQRAIGTS